MKLQITNYIRAGYPGIYLVSHEEARVENEIRTVTNEINFDLWAWSLTEGLVNVKEGEEVPETQDPIAVLNAIKNVPERSVILLRDFHMFIEPNPMLLRALKDTLLLCKASNRVLVIVGCQMKMQPEIEKEFVIIEFKLPDIDQLGTVLSNVTKAAKVKIEMHCVETVLNSASGLTCTEAENAYALSIIECGTVSPVIVSREKASTVKKNGLLEIIENNITLGDIGGLEHLKCDLSAKRNLFTKGAREYGLPTPRGILVVGQPGTGKSLTASATKSIFGIPLIKLEAGRIFGSLVGESERNWRLAFATVKAIAPCVLWIDEVDGLFSGGESSGRTDGGTTQRVIKAILQDMQFNSDGVFFVFTANDVDNLPDPLIDRLDVWSVDLPTKTEREDIWKIQIAKRGRKPAKFNLKELADSTAGFSGRQIEQVWIKAMTGAFNAGREPKESDIDLVCVTEVPTSVTMSDAIERRRKRLQNRAKPAGKPEEKAEKGTRKLATK